MGSRALRSWLLVASAGLAAIPSGSAAAAVAPQQSFESYLEEADEDAAAGRHAEALRAYADAAGTMPYDLKVGSVGELVALAAASSAIADYRARGDVESLRLGQRILRDFITAASTASTELEPVSTTIAEQELEELERLEAGIPEPRGDSENAEPAAATASDPELEPSVERDSSRLLGTRGKVGVGLLVAGGLAAGTGVPLLIRKPRTFPTGHPNADKIETTRPVGGAVLAAGVALLATGAVLLVLDVQRRKRADGRTAAEVAVNPWFGSSMGGFGVNGRF